jgi:ankyrin repeat protein
VVISSNSPTLDFGLNITHSAWITDTRKSKLYARFFLFFFQGYTNLVRYLVSQGANVNAQTKFDEYTALIFAAYYGHSDVAKILLQNGADVSRTNSNGYSALILSANYGDAEIVKLLIEVIFMKIAKRNFIFCYQNCSDLL